MEPQGAPAPAPDPAAQGQGQSPGSASKLVTSINDQLQQLMQLVAGSDAVDEDDKAQLGSIIQGFQGFVDGLGQSKGKGASGPVPAEAGTADVKPVM
jgi:hypothetical protein